MTTVLLISLVVVVGTFVQVSVGFGLNILLTPAALLLWPELVPGAAVAANLAVSVAVAVRFCRDMNPQVVGWALAGSVPGTALGVVCLKLLDRSLGIGASLAILLAVLSTVCGLRWSTTRSSSLAAGTATKDR